MNDVKRKYGIAFGAIAVVLVMLSSVTAVPNMGSDSIMDSFENQKSTVIEQLEDIWVHILEDESLQIAELQEYYDILEYIISDEFIDILIDKIDDPSEVDPLEAFVVFLIAIILWIPAIIVIILGSPLIFLYEFAQYYGYYFYGIPGGIIASAVIALLLTLAIVILGCGLWPFLVVGYYVTTPPPS